MSRPRVTMAAVAAHAGVSKTAVSLVMNDRPGTRLSEDVARRIRASADELGYRPNLTARALTTQRSQIVGFISHLVTTGRFGNDLIRGALDEAARQGHVLFIAETAGHPGAAQQAVDALIDRQVDGIVFAATRPESLDVPEVTGTPVVMLNATAERPAPAVLADERSGARRIVDLLLARGGEETLLVVGRSRDQPEDATLTVGVRRRMEGIRESLDAHGITPAAEIPCEPWTLENGYAAVKGALDAGIRPTALVCLNDRLAFGAYRALGEAGLRVGEDVSVVSFDDDDIAVYLEPPLTTAAFPYEEMGALAVRLLLSDGQGDAEHLVEMPLRVRGSIRAG